ncbi:hypothetical protein DIPPA_28269 [Diplonema papillatum]|nr:hypothetical protein DIPPA_28269 [Diplonema papillatum]
MADRVTWKTRADTLQAANDRLKGEAKAREAQIEQIKTQFAAIVEELRKRDLPDGVSSTHGSRRPHAASGGAADDGGVAKLQKLLAKTRHERDDWEKKCKQLRLVRSRTPDGAKDGKENAELWKRRFLELKAELSTKLEARPPARVGTLRALRPRRLADVREAATSPKTTSPRETNPPSTRHVDRALSPPKKLMNAWVQTQSTLQTDYLVTDEISSPVVTRAQVAAPPGDRRSYSPHSPLQPAFESSCDNVHAQALIESLRRENLSLQGKLEEALSARQASESQLQVVAHERNVLATQDRGAAGTRDDVAELRRELAERSAKLVVLDARFSQAEQATTSLKRNQEDLIAELERMNDKLSIANTRALEAENALQVARIGEGRIEGLEARLRERDEEVRLLNTEIDRLMQKCHATQSEVTRELRTEWEGQLEDRTKALEESERNNKKLFRDAQLASQQREEVREAWVQAQKERDVLEMQALKHSSENEALRARVQLFGPDTTPADEEDVHKALALIQFHRRRGDPEDIEFLAKAWDSSSAEMQDLRSENVELIRELEVARSLLRARQERVAQEVERAQGLQRAAGDKNQLLADMGERLRSLTDEMARYRGVGQKLSTDSDAGSVAAGPNENVLEISLAHATLDEAADGGEPGLPPTVFMAIDFLDFETVFTETATGHSVSFARYFSFTVAVSDALRHYVQHKKVTIELRRAVGLGSELLGKGAVPLTDLLAPSCQAARGHISLCDDSGAEVAVSEFCLKLKKPLPYEWLGVRPSSAAVSAEAGVVQAFRSVKAMKLVVQECRALSCLGEPVPYVFVTPISTVRADRCILPDVTAELAQPKHTRDPVFRYAHEYNIRVDAGVAQYLAGASLNFVVLDDAALDARTPPIGKASVSLSSLLEGPAAAIEAVLDLTSDGATTGQIVVSLRWVRYASTPLYIEGALHT